MLLYHTQLPSNVMLAGMKTKVLLYQTTNFFGSTVEGLLGKESDDQIESKVTFLCLRTNLNIWCFDGRSVYWKTFNQLAVKIPHYYKNANNKIQQSTYLWSVSVSPPVRPKKSCSLSHNSLRGIHSTPLPFFK